MASILNSVGAPVLAADAVMEKEEAVGIVDLLERARPQTIVSQT